MIKTCYNCKGFRYVWIPTCNKPVACPTCDGCGELELSKQYLLLDGNYEVICTPAHRDFHAKSKRKDFTAITYPNQLKLL